MGREVWGPAFTELGSPAEGDTITRDPREIKHPQLYGPSTKGGKTLMEGIGLVAESKNAQLANSGSLPSSSGLGSDGNSGFLPYSRVPGDQDMIPNPYLPGGEFSSSTYSVKTEPVPFLTDFSAFMK
jgi:hypothetical protein